MLRPILPLSNRMQRLPSQFFAGLTQQVQAYIEQGRDVINLGQGNPDLPTPAHIVEALRDSVQDPATHRYGPFHGLASLRSACAEFYRREYGVVLDPDSEVAILFGGKAGLIEISQIYLNEGDVALVPDPGYPDYESGIKIAGARMATMPLVPEQHFMPDLEAALASEPDAKLMFLNYPSNPTGAVVDSSLFEQVVRMAQSRKMLVVHDFAYASIGFDSIRPMSFLEVEGARDCGIEIYTLSKTYNMAGWRVAFAVGQKEAIAALKLYHNHAYVSLFPAIQKAAESALLGPQDEVHQRTEIYQKRRDAFYLALHQKGISAKPPQGTFFGWLPLPEGISSLDFASRLLQEKGVAVAAGVGFGQHGEGYVRVGFLDREERLMEAAHRIADWMIQNQNG